MLVACLGAFGACGTYGFRRPELYTVDATGAGLPVMVSQAPAQKPGRAIEAESGEGATVSQSTQVVPTTTGTAQVTVTTTTSAESELTASMKLMSQVRRVDRWVQIKEIMFHARDLSSYGFYATERRLSISAEAHR